jgi:hypothetical protein
LGAYLKKQFYVIKIENYQNRKTYCKMNKRKSAMSSTNHSGIAANISGISVGNIILAFGMYGVP